MARGLLLAAAVLICLTCAGPAFGAAAGGDLAVTTSEHALVLHKVQINITGRVPRDGMLYVFRNRGAGCGSTLDSERRLGSSKARQVHAPLAVNDAFDLVTGYTPSVFGMKEAVCTYLYTLPVQAGLPPDIYFYKSPVNVGFAVPRGAQWQSATTSFTAIKGSLTRVHASGTCGGSSWSIPSLKVKRDGSFSVGGSLRLFGQVSRTLQSVSGTIFNGARQCSFSAPRAQVAGK
jgi:hypothetical protein